MSFFVVVLSPPPQKKPQKKQLLVNLLIYILTFLSYVYLHVCMSSYITLHVTTCIGYFFFLKHKQSLFFKHLSNPAHLFLFSLVILCKKNESIGNGEPSPLLKKILQNLYMGSWEQAEREYFRK